ncbi:hypothetical protein SAMN04487948_11285 [Halogranum amylolyticum]|uniref:Membrane protein YjdF n=1 Tax=Halogranum amylolyticum TaxID=660520 RepID=A0A1H8USG4_9EURY|nr:hypothetical protein [Halogranum amylolyticum]SEP06129.1 hypothetical protein SAMN04487948_11285 [Halogranum amylolyticum]
MSLARRLHLSERRELRFVRGLQTVIILVLGLGLWFGNVGVVVNAGVGLIATFVPTYLERSHRIVMDAGLVLWITAAMFLHALGTLPLPGLDFLSPYQAVWWWDHLTHTFSASLVAGIAYATLRAVEVHSDGITLSPAFRFVYLLLFTMAFGVVWELLEFAIGEVARLSGTAGVLTQYGLDDTVLDLMYDTVGGLLVAIFGTVHLTGLSDQLAARLDARSTKR